MQAGQLINDFIPPLRSSDTGARALKWMNIFQVNHLPVLHEKNYLGLLSRQQLSQQLLSDKISSYNLELPHPCLLTSQHMYDVFTFAANYDFTVIPVLDEQHHYAGLITHSNLIKGFVEMKSLNTQGSIIVIEVKIKDFQLSHIIQVVESNEAKVLNADVHIDTSIEMVEVTMKINRLDLSRIESAFFRYNYVVKAIYHQSDFSDDLQNRFDSLMNYLNI